MVFMAIFHDQPELCSGIQKATEKLEKAQSPHNSIFFPIRWNLESAEMLNSNWYYTPEQRDAGLCNKDWALPHIGNVTRFHQVIYDHSVITIVSFFIIIHLDLHNFHPLFVFTPLLICYLAFILQQYMNALFFFYCLDIKRHFIYLEPALMHKHKLSIKLQVHSVAVSQLCLNTWVLGLGLENLCNHLHQVNWEQQKKWKHMLKLAPHRN